MLLEPSSGAVFEVDVYSGQIGTLPQDDFGPFNPNAPLYPVELPLDVSVDVVVWPEDVVVAPLDVTPSIDPMGDLTGLTDQPLIGRDILL